MNQILTDDDIEQLTGAKQPAKQSDVLMQHGIYFIRRQDGKIVTTWHHVNHPARRFAVNDSEPDFSGLQ